MEDEARLNRERSYNVDDYKIWSVANITFYPGEEGLYTIIRSFGIKVENIIFHSRSQSMIFDPPQWINENGDKRDSDCLLKIIWRSKMIWIRSIDLSAIFVSKIDSFFFIFEITLKIFSFSAYVLRRIDWFYESTSLKIDKVLSCKNIGTVGYINVQKFVNYFDMLDALIQAVFKIVI